MPINHARSVAKHFDERSRAYAESVSTFQGDTLGLIARVAEPRPTDLVLDAGSGPGFVAHALAKSVRVAVGLDLSLEMGRAASRRAAERSITRFHPTVGDLQIMPLGNESIDLIVSRFAMHHCPEVEIALSEMRRVGRRGGSLVICDTAAPEAPDVARRMNEIEKMRDPSHVRNLSHSEWKALLERCGFEVDWTEQSRIVLEFHNWVERAATPASSVAELRRTFESPPADFRDAFEIIDEGDCIFFSWPVSLLRGIKPAD
ncbi:MAG: methyltransferase domain-containing protein [bacterium]|nr:methyltransferase domain-containing protein [bacterium]